MLITPTPASHPRNTTIPKCRSMAHVRKQHDTLEPLWAVNGAGGRVMVGQVGEAGSGSVEWLSHGAHR